MNLQDFFENFFSPFLTIIRNASSLFIFIIILPAFTYASNLAPYAAHWCIDSSVTGCKAQTLQEWQPSDRINQFYAQKTPLSHQTNVTNPDNDTLIIPFIDFDTSKTSAEMVESDTIQPQLTFWQYLQRLTYFGGSQSEGQVLAPQPGWIKAAHQNGVKILGSLFFSPSAFGGDKELAALNNMLKNPMPYITQLVSIAKTLGFDGYFINNEADESISINNKFTNFINLFHEEAKKQGVDLSLDWYQVPAGALNKNLFVDENGNIISDDVFLDYDWTFNANYLSSTVASWNYPLSKLGFGIYDAYDPTGYSHQALYDIIFPGTTDNLGSVDEFAFEEILNPHHSNISLNQQLLNETQFWMGTQGWTGASKYVPTMTAVTTLPFSTAFNTGQGNHYFINGTDTHIGAWHDMGQQDLLPTWRFQMMNEVGNTVNANFDYSDSYVGGSHLLISGVVSLNAKTIIDLYAAHLVFSDIPSQLVLNVISKSSTPNAAITQICLYTADNEKHCFALSQTKSWNMNSYVLSTLSNKIIDKISIEISGTQPQPTELTLNIGYIFIGSVAESIPPNAPTQAQSISNDLDINGNVHHYISWSPVPNVKYYNIYSKNNFAARTNQTIFDVVDKHRMAQLSVSAINNNNIESDKIKI